MTVIAFFLLTRKILIETLGELKADIAALVASLFLSVLPAILPRTIAGIPEKESSGFLFLFLSLYLFLVAWKSKKTYYQFGFAIVAGITTAAMALVWGGYVYIIITLSIAILMAFLLGQVKRRKLIIAILWLLPAFLIMNLYSARYTFFNIVGSTATAIILGTIALAALHLLIFETSLRRYFETQSLNKIPKPLISAAVFAIIFVVLTSAIFGLGFIPDKLMDITKPIIAPISDRIGVTVAENRQPFFNEWASSFGPILNNNIPLFFWLFFFGSIYLYGHMMKIFSKKERWISIFAYAFFLFAIIFSRYSSTSTFNGTNGASIILYLAGVLALVGTFTYYYYIYNQEGKAEKLRELDFGLIMLFSLFFLSIISARGSVRTIMVLVPSASMIVGFLVVELSDYALKKKDQTYKLVFGAIAIIVIIASAYSAYSFYNESSATAQAYVPSIYTQQWQKAMSWVRDNTPENAVFGHWWDYGYWVQSMANRATVLDGGNAIAYWDYLMGRHGLTSSNERDALNFLYAHNTTHFLIDSSDIGKYTAFSSIGSDNTNDRYSWMPPLVSDPKQVQEKKNSTVFVYSGGGIPVDQDIVRTLNGTKLSTPLPEGKSYLLAILVERDSTGTVISQPIGVYLYQNNQYQVPLRYVFDKKLIDFNSGIQAGIFLFPRVDQTSTGSVQIDQAGAALYLTNKTVMSQLARLYLYKEEDQYFKLVHNEDDLYVAYLKTQTNLTSDFAYLGGTIRGPIRIWQINYPSSMTVDPEMLRTTYPDPKLSQPVQ